MRDYRSHYEAFTVEALERSLYGRPLSDGANVCDLCCDRWAGDPQAVALNFVARDFSQQPVTFAAFRKNSARFANLLTSRGIGRGDVVAGMLPRTPELLTVILGTWRAGAIYQPLFTAFGPAAIQTRVGGAGRPKLIVTDAANRPKLDDVIDAPPALLADRDALAEALSGESVDFAPVALGPDDPFIQLYTSGTTGGPKCVRHSLKLLDAAAVYMTEALDLRAEDRFWNLADPGWAYGLYYAVFGPLMLGHATTFYEGAFSVEAAARVISALDITNLAAAPTAYRALMAAGEAAMAPVAGRLRVASSAGEPLNPEVARWAERVLRCPLADHYGQTEIAMAINNHHALAHPRKEGSAGVAMPGFDLAILDDALRPVPDGTAGVLAVRRANSPLMPFSGYFGAETPQLTLDWYVTGDTMTRDADGCYFFTGRNDDIITSAGYRIGPFDVESALIEHPAVAEAAVVGKPDPERTEIVKAFVVLRPGFAPATALATELSEHVRTRLSRHAYPREVEFLAELPKTPSGKVQRFVLRARG